MGLNFTDRHERLAKPKQKIFVLGITGLTNLFILVCSFLMAFMNSQNARFSGSTVEAHSLPLIEKRRSPHEYL